MGAISAAISGLQSSQTWLDVIGNNVSNSQTVGYKSTRADFATLISLGLSEAQGPDPSQNLGGVNPMQIGMGVQVDAVQTLFTQGAVQVTGNATDVAVEGSGFLTVQDGQQTQYTRAGNLTIDGQGNLVTSTGALVQGWELPTTQNSSGSMSVTGGALNTSNNSSIGNIVIPDNLVLAPKATSSIASPNAPGGVMLAGNLDNNTPLNANALPVNAPATAAQLAAFTPDATSTFTVTDSLGTQFTYAMQWQQVANTPATGAQWQWTLWNVTGNVPPNTAAVWPAPGSEVAASGGWVAAGGTNNTQPPPPPTPPLIGSGITNVTFNPDGSLATNGVPDTPGLPPTTNFSNIQISLPDLDGATSPLTFSINLGTPNDNVAPPATSSYGLRNGVTGDFGGGKISPTTGVYVPVQTIYTKSTDGYTEGLLTGLAFNQSGGINASFSNSQTVTVAQLALATFTNENGLLSVGATSYVSTANSGSAQLGTAGTNGLGTITGGALETSNVNMTLELTNMILAQNMFEANSRMITSADQVVANVDQVVQNMVFQA